MRNGKQVQVIWQMEIRMPRETIAIEMNVPCTAVFDVIHDYGCRLQWDSMLSKAYLLGDTAVAGVGVRTLCVGTWRSAFLALETEYIRYEPGRMAAVKLTNHPPFFDQFAATIRHDPLGENRSLTTYIYYFRARPHFLAPIMNLLLKRETQNRLRALRDYLETG